ncbi:radical SAM protein [Marinitoga sp. 1197]|uniref:radical SAM protein n=1 Tax=Marinitoga sp. 1197 TaxID=1428449 RepID=UPI000641533F|nr:radical SAM protein [Marinitoga sp. 1197]KLO24446.1 radical SAM protein [Marinitoga sp. 1197]
MSYVFGPVPSRRLGNSLGINLTPLKTCNYSCIYCQLGKTTNFTNKRMEYFPTEEIIEELKHSIEHSELSIDYITFVGDGEPTLHNGIGKIINWIRKNYKDEFKIAVVTNGSLLYDKKVRNELLNADLILPSIDASDEKKFRLINRPIFNIEYEKIIEGLRIFAKEFKGEIWIEIMLMKDINDSKEDIEKIAEIIKSIDPLPNKVFINTPVRPPVEKWVGIPSKKSLNYAEKIIPNAVSISYREEGEFDVSRYKNSLEAILDITEKHPLRLEQVEKIISHFEENTKDVLNALANFIRIVEYDNQKYLIKKN